VYFSFKVVLKTKLMKPNQSPLNRM